MNKIIPIKQFVIYLLTLLITISCKTYSEDDHKKFENDIQHFISKNKLSGFEISESGLYYKIINEGKGDYIKLTDEVTFNYEGKLLNGKIFDGEHKKNPITFQMKDLIEGWKEGMLYIKPGGKIKLLVPPNLGYGDYKLDHIPPHSILYFDIEVLSTK